MMLNTETVEFRGETLEVKELTVRQMAPFLEQLTEEDAITGQLELLKTCVYWKGKPLGDEGLDQLPGAAFRELIPVAMRVNGMSSEDESAGGNED